MSRGGLAELGNLREPVHGEPVRRRGIGWGSFLGGVLLLLVTGCEQAPKTLLDSAEARWKQGDYLGAVQMYEQLIDEYPKSSFVADAYYAIGTIEYLYLKDYPKALEAFRKVVADRPTGPLVLQAHRTLAEIYDKEYHDHRRVIAEYQKLLEKTRDRAVSEEIQYRIGEAYFDQGDFEQARSEWDQLPKQAPKSEWADKALYRTGSSYFLQGRYNKALAVFQDTARRYPDSSLRVERAFWTANCLEELERFEEALKLYRSLEKSYPNPKVIEVKVRSIKSRMKATPVRPAVKT